MEAWALQQIELKKGVDGQEYKVSNGTWYNKETEDNVIHTLETCRVMNYPVRLFLGDVKTGRDWLEENDVTGRIGRSMGPIKVPILLANSRSIGGGSILTHCIVRIIYKVESGAKREWRAANYQQPEFHVLTPGSVFVVGEGTYHAAFRGPFGMDKARRYVDFMSGRRMTK